MTPSIARRELESREDSRDPRPASESHRTSSVSRIVGSRSPEETGATLRENADLKALHAARASGLLALADDSGLEVEALAGQPGVRSARFAGRASRRRQESAGIARRIVRNSERSRDARFVCAVTIATPEGIVGTSQGVVNGTILDRERGSRGFGYDALFLLPSGRTIAELLDEEKNEMSHRSVAIRNILPQLERALASTKSHLALQVIANPVPPLPRRSTLPTGFAEWRARLDRQRVAPVVAVAGSKGKTSVLRAVESIFRAGGYRFATWTDRGVEIEGERQRGELGPWSRALTRLAAGGLDIAFQELDWATVPTVSAPGAKYPIVAVANLCANSEACFFTPETLQARRALAAYQVKRRDPWSAGPQC